MHIAKKTIFEVKGNPEVGKTVEIRGRTFRLIAAEPRTTRRGQRSYLFTWLGYCDQCGNSFTYTTTRQVDALANCEEHRWGIK